RSDTGRSFRNRIGPVAERLNAPGTGRKVNQIIKDMIEYGCWDPTAVAVQYGREPLHGDVAIALPVHIAEIFLESAQYCFGDILVAAINWGIGSHGAIIAALQGGESGDCLLLQGIGPH